MCDPCWKERSPGREPYRVTTIYRAVPFLARMWPVRPPKKRCCFCGKKTRSGIYVSVPPEKVPCHGEHE